MKRRKQEAWLREIMREVVCECMPGIVREVVHECVPGIVRGEMREELGAAVVRVIEALKPKDVQPKYQYTQAQVAEYLAKACQLKGLPKRYALSRRTIQRMERNEAPLRAGYTAAVRLNQATLFAWICDYVRGVLTKLDPDKAISFDENLLAHQIRV